MDDYCLTMFAQVVDMTVWTSLIGSVVQVGFSIVVGIYLLTKAIPRMQDKHDEMLASMHKAHAEERVSERDEFLARLKELKDDDITQMLERRIEYKESLKAITDHCEKESDRRDKMLQSEFSAHTEALQNLALTIEELRQVYKKDTA